MGKQKGKHKERSVRSKVSQEHLEVVKRINLGHIPLFIQLAHKGLEKSMPEGTVDSGGTSFNVPKDILSLSISKPEILEAIESVEVVYRSSTSAG